MTFIFIRVSRYFDFEKLFYIMISIFLGFFALFSLVLYPFRDALHPNEFADRLAEILPLGFKGMIAVFRNWVFTLFYVMSELWSTTIMTVLFWGFLNASLSLERAQRFYMLLMVGGNIGGIVAGQAAVGLSTLGKEWGASINLICSVVVFAGLMTMAIFYWFQRHGFERMRSFEGKSQIKDPPIRMGVRQNMALILNSKYLLSIALIVLAYNVFSNLTEVIWKGELKLLCPDSNHYNIYMGKVVTWTGVISVMIALVANRFLQTAKWSTIAIISPLIMLVTSVGFFLFLMFNDLGIKTVTILGFTPLAISVFFGAAQNCLMRSVKYTIFESTKEIAFIPLDKESKLKGKAAIDGIGSRLGKSGGAAIYQGLLLFVGTLGASIPYVACILFAVIFLWILGVISLGKQFTSLVKEDEQIHPLPQ